jgi:hypothetical protein
MTMILRVKTIGEGKSDIRTLTELEKLFGKAGERDSSTIGLFPNQ